MNQRGTALGTWHTSQLIKIWRCDTIGVVVLVHDAVCVAACRPTEKAPESVQNHQYDLVSFGVQCALCMDSPKDGKGSKARTTVDIALQSIKIVKDFVPLEPVKGALSAVCQLLELLQVRKA